jgi:hypothetical protein
MYDFSTDPFGISLYMRKILFSFLSECLGRLHFMHFMSDLKFNLFS